MGQRWTRMLRWRTGRQQSREEGRAGEVQRHSWRGSSQRPTGPHWDCLGNRIYMHTRHQCFFETRAHPVDPSDCPPAPTALRACPPRTPPQPVRGRGGGARHASITAGLATFSEKSTAAHPWLMLMDSTSAASQK